MAMRFSDRYVVQSFTAAGTATLGGIQGMPGMGSGLQFGANIAIDTNGNFAANLLADLFGDGTWSVDVTSLMFGGATITQANHYGFSQGFFPWNLLINVTSVQTGKYVRFANAF